MYYIFLFIALLVGNMFFISLLANLLGGGHNLILSAVIVLSTTICFSTILLLKALSKIEKN